MHAVLKYLKLSRFSLGVVNNSVSFIIIGISGILINFLILFKYDVAMLGVFNQLIAVYVVLSQIINVGLYYSILNFTSDPAYKKTQKIDSIFSALLFGFVISIPIIILIKNNYNHFSYLFDSDYVGNAVHISSYALGFFSANKILIAGLNGLGKLFEVAIFNAIRPILAVSFLVAVIFFDLDQIKIFYMFLFSETILFTIILTYYKVNNNFPKLYNNIPKYFRWHIKYGLKSIPNALLIEFNPKVDIMLIGYVFSDYIAGMYSIASMVAEGQNQIPQIFMVNLNHRISKLYKKKKITILHKLIKNTRKFIYIASFIAFLISNISIAFIIYGFQSYNEYFMVLNFNLILTTGTLLFSGYYPFQMIFTQNNYPGSFTIFLLFVFLFNIFFSVILIKYFSFYGIAFGTALTSFATIFFLKYFTRFRLKIRL